MGAAGDDLLEGVEEVDVDDADDDDDACCGEPRDTLADGGPGEARGEVGADVDAAVPIVMLRIKV